MRNIYKNYRVVWKMEPWIEKKIDIFFHIGILSDFAKEREGGIIHYFNNLEEFDKIFEYIFPNSKYSLEFQNNEWKILNIDYLADIHGDGSIGRKS